MRTAPAVHPAGRHAVAKPPARHPRRRTKRPSLTRRPPPIRRSSKPDPQGAPQPNLGSQPATIPPLPVPASPGPSPGAPAPPLADEWSGRLFSSDSVWNALVATEAPVDPSSPERMAAFTAEVDQEVAAVSGPWINDTAYTTPLYVVPADQPRVSVALDVSWGAGLHAAFAAGVPLPNDAVPSAGSDGQLTVYQPATDTLWEFWQLARTSSGWHASWGGAMRDVSNSPGFYTSSSWPSLAGIEGWNWGATATSLPAIGGTITVAELQRGEIDHALAMAIPDACANWFTWPAQRGDGGSSAPDCLPEGARLRLDANLDLSSLDLPPVTRMLAKAAQRYGIIVRDVTHHAVGFYAEDPRPVGTNPYVGPSGLYGGLQPWQFLPQFPWHRLELLELTPCTAAPCLPPS